MATGSLHGLTLNGYRIIRPRLPDSVVARRLQALGLRFARQLDRGTRTVYVAAGWDRDGRAVVVKHSNDPEVQREEVAALTHWSSVGLAPRVLAVPDPVTVVIEYLDGEAIDLERDGGVSAAVEVGILLFALHSHQPHDANAPRLTELPSAPLHLLGPDERDALWAAERVIADDHESPVLLHGDPHPGNFHRARSGGIFALDPMWRRGSAHEDLARFALLVASAVQVDPVDVLHDVYRGYGRPFTHLAAMYAMREHFVASAHSREVVRKLVQR